MENKPLSLRRLVESRFLDCQWITTNHGDGWGCRWCGGRHFDLSNFLLIELFRIFAFARRADDITNYHKRVHNTSARAMRPVYACACDVTTHKVQVVRRKLMVLYDDIPTVRCSTLSVAFTAEKTVLRLGVSQRSMYFPAVQARYDSALGVGECNRGHLGACARCAGTLVVLSDGCMLLRIHIHDGHPHALVRP